MGLSSRQLQIIESKLSSLELEGQNAHEAVNHYVIKVKSWITGLKENPETSENSFFQVSMDLEKKVLYLAQKTEEINMINFTETLDISLASAESTTCLMTSSLTKQSGHNSEQFKSRISQFESEIIKLRDELKAKARVKSVNNKIKAMEDQMHKCKTGLETLIKEKDETVESLEKRLQKGERRLLDINRLEEELNKSERERIIMAQEIETLKNGLQEGHDILESVEIEETLNISESEINQTSDTIKMNVLKVETAMFTLEEKIRQCEEDKKETDEAVKKMIQKIQTDVAKVKEIEADVKERLKQTEEDGRETAMMVKKRLIKLEMETQKKMTDTVGNVGRGRPFYQNRQYPRPGSKSNSANDKTDSNEEVEVCDKICDGQWESERLKKRDCIKKPGHEGFMDISKLKLEYLPKCYHDNLVLDYIKSWANMVVRVMVKYVSPARPDGYFLADKRGQHIHSYGSGWVWFLEGKYTEKKNEHCPCSICQTSVTPHRQWALFRVVTAMNVVYDSEEATKTICELFYDSEEVRGQGLLLEGVKVYDRNVDENWCRMICVTHDQELIKKLEVILARKDILVQELNRKYRSTKPDDNIAVVVSHPHGCKKQISLGNFTHRQTVAPNKIYYSVPTCPGSSGGLVWLPGQGQSTSSICYVSTHSGGSQEGNNISTG